MTYIDVNPTLFNADGEPRLSLYRDDGLHFHPHAYDEFLVGPDGARSKPWILLIHVEASLPYIARHVPGRHLSQDRRVLMEAPV
jgi:hypothetical protein